MVKKKVKAKSEPTATQKAIAKIRETPRGERTPLQVEDLSRLLDDEKRERFLRNAVGRVKKACTAIDNVGRLGNTATYKYSPEESDRIKQKIAASVAAMEKAFSANGVSDDWKLFDQ